MKYLKISYVTKNVLGELCCAGSPSSIPAVAPLMAIFSMKWISSSWLVTNFVWFCTKLLSLSIYQRQKTSTDMHGKKHTYKFLRKNIHKSIDFCLMLQKKWTDVSSVYVF
jgi:hypothetical protein